MRTLYDLWLEIEKKSIVNTIFNRFNETFKNLIFIVNLEKMH